jgi:spore germination protein GerM
MTATAPRRHRIRCAIAGTLAVLLALASCGISEDGEPHAIAPDNLPPDLLDPNPASSTTLPKTETVPVTVYLLRQSSEGPVLVPVEREVTNRDDPGQRITAVLDAQPTTEERARNLSSAIPADVELLGAPLDPETSELTIDLSGDFFDIRGPGVISAFAQIVYTAAELDGVRTIRFRVDSEPIQATDGDGAQQSAVDTSDYRALAPE